MSFVPGPTKFSLPCRKWVKVISRCENKLLQTDIQIPKRLMKLLGIVFNSKTLKLSDASVFSDEICAGKVHAVVALHSRGVGSGRKQENSIT